jgi:hypothetical protein
MSEIEDKSAAEARGLICRLSDFRARAAARARLVAIGKAAVPELCRALESPLEGVAWIAASVLGDIGAQEAVDALIGALSNPRGADAAREALKRITGKDLGDDAAAWRRWRESGAQGGAATSDEDFAKSLATGETSIEKTASGYAYTVQLAGGRRQRVDLVLTFKDADGTPLVVLYSECGPASANRYEWALKANMRSPFGAVALRDTNDGPKFAVVDTYLRDAVTTKQLTRALAAVAARADAMEQQLTGLDRI